MCLSSHDNSEDMRFMAGSQCHLINNIYHFEQFVLSS